MRPEHHFGLRVGPEVAQHVFGHEIVTLALPAGGSYRLLHRAGERLGLGAVGASGQGGSGPDQRGGLLSEGFLTGGVFDEFVNLIRLEVHEGRSSGGQVRSEFDQQARAAAGVLHIHRHKVHGGFAPPRRVVAAQPHQQVADFGGAPNAKAQACHCRFQVIRRAGKVGVDGLRPRRVGLKGQRGKAVLLHQRPEHPRLEHKMLVRAVAALAHPDEACPGERWQKTEVRRARAHRVHRPQQGLQGGAEAPALGARQRGGVGHGLLLPGYIQPRGQVAALYDLPASAYFLPGVQRLAGLGEGQLLAAHVVLALAAEAGRHVVGLPLPREFERRDLRRLEGEARRRLGQRRAGQDFVAWAVAAELRGIDRQDAGGIARLKRPRQLLVTLADGGLVGVARAASEGGGQQGKSQSKGFFHGETSGGRSRREGCQRKVTPRTPPRSARRRCAAGRRRPTPPRERKRQWRFRHSP